MRDLGIMAELFQRDKSIISRHIQNAYDEGDCEVSREIEFYSLDMIISVGYRVKSHRGTQFRIWASRENAALILRAYFTPLQQRQGLL